MVIVWDFDGPILSNRKKYHKVLVETLKILEKNSTQFSEDIYWENKRIKMKENEFILFENQNEYDLFNKIRIALIESPYYTKYDSLQYGIINILTELKLKGFINILLTMRNNSWSLHKQISNLGIDKYFNMVLNSDNNSGDLGVKAELIEKNILVNTKINEIIMIGDTEGDLLTANNLNVSCLAVSYGIRTNAYLKSLNPYKIFDQPSELNDYLRKTYCNS